MEWQVRHISLQTYKVDFSILLQKTPMRWRFTYHSKYKILTLSFSFARSMQLTVNLFYAPYEVLKLKFAQTLSCIFFTHLSWSYSWGWVEAPPVFEFQNGVKIGWDSFCNSFAIYRLYNVHCTYKGFNVNHNSHFQYEGQSWLLNPKWKIVKSNPPDDKRRKGAEYLVCFENTTVDNCNMCTHHTLLPNWHGFYPARWCKS